jgi:hypothetical protein
MYIGSTVSETKKYHIIRFCRVGARAAANRGYVSKRKHGTMLEGEALEKGYKRVEKEIGRK